jgi:hypothetical protein
MVVLLLNWPAVLSLSGPKIKAVKEKASRGLQTFPPRVDELPRAENAAHRNSVT